MFASTELRKARYGLLRTVGELEGRIRELSGGKPRILFIAPHLSTGGMPQYLYKKIECLYDDAEIYCIQYSNTTDHYVVQRDRISKKLGDNFYCLGEDKKEILSLINEICPDVIHFDDFVEFFVEESICDEIFSLDRPYFIYETCHSSNVSPEDKRWVPDKIVMVNQWMVNKFSSLSTPLDILEYPIEDNERPPRDEALEKLGLDPSLKHIINVGLFTPGKNQGLLIEFARMMTDYPVQFHFIGNQAPNFQSYWEPLMTDLPSNCKIWGERNDTDDFYAASDLFVFTSNWELNPIVIKETLSWKLPILMRRLEPYMDFYDDNPLVSYLVSRGGNIGADVDKIKEILGFA
jgi:glycosyltransferase involved in cell wall biosynthesis